MAKSKINAIRYAKRQNVALGNNEPYLFSRRYALKHYASGAVYTFIPKNACSTMRFSLAIENGFVDKSTDPNWIHNNINRNSALFRASDNDIVTSGYTFVIIRCPYKRLASAFLDKAVDLKMPFQMQCKTIHPWINSAQEFVDFAGNMTFSSFVESITSLPHEKLDEHFRNQIDFLVFDDYDKWFSLENFNVGKVVLKDDLGFIVYDTRDHIGHHISGLTNKSGDYSNTKISELNKMKCLGVVPDALSLFDQESKRLVDDYFDEDLKLYRERFGEEGLLFKSST